MSRIVFVDSEINSSGKICDLGAVTPEGGRIHTSSHSMFSDLVSGCKYVCGHNLIAHDMKYISNLIPGDRILIDTLPMSPLLFPKKPYHHLLKDYKIQT